MKNAKLTTVQAVAAASMMLGVVMPLSPVYGQEVAEPLATTAKEACISAAKVKGFDLKEVISTTAKGTDGADVILHLTRDGQLYKLTCGYTPGGTMIGDETAEPGTAMTKDSDLSGLWWALLPLAALLGLLWWLKGRGHSDAATPVGRYPAIIRHPGSSLDIHSGPGTGYDVTGTLHDGERVTLSGRYDNNWAELVDGGWIPNQYVEKSSYAAR